MYSNGRYFGTISKEHHGKRGVCGSLAWIQGEKRAFNGVGEKKGDHLGERREGKRKDRSDGNTGKASSQKGGGRGVVLERGEKLGRLHEEKTCLSFKEERRVGKKGKKRTQWFLGLIAGVIWSFSGGEKKKGKKVQSSAGKVFYPVQKGSTNLLLGPGRKRPSISAKYL